MNIRLRYLKGIILAGFILISLGGPVLAQPGGHMKGGTGHWSASDTMQRGNEMRHGAGMQGMGFMHSGAELFGQYTTFTANNTTGEITQYGIAGTEIFDSIAIEGFKYGDTIASRSMTRIIDSDSTTFIQMHDNPSGVINIVSSDAYTISFDLAEDVTATEEDNTVKIGSSAGEVYIYYSAVAGSFDISIADGMVVIEAPEDSTIVVRALPVNMPAIANMHRMLGHEIGRNGVGAEVYLGLNNSMDVVNYSAHMRIQREFVNSTMIRLRVNSSDPTGKVLAFNLDNTSLMLQERDRLMIHYDGTPLACMNDPDQIFNSTGPACWISQQSQNQAQIMVHVPEFSERIIDIVVESEEGVDEEATKVEEASEVPTTPKSDTPGFESVIATIGILSVMYLIRKKP
jgi:hypothetical protein